MRLTNNNNKKKFQFFSKLLFTSHDTKTRDQSFIQICNNLDLPQQNLDLYYFGKKQKANFE